MATRPTAPSLAKVRNLRKAEIRHSPHHRAPAGRPVPSHWEEIMHQLDWQCAEILGNWEELVLLMGNVTRQVEAISDWWELRHAWRLHTGVVAAAAYRLGLRMGRQELTANQEGETNSIKPSLS